MSLIKTLAELRRDFVHGSFTEKNANPEPLEQFKLWYQDAVDAGGHGILVVSD